MRPAHGRIAADEVMEAELAGRGPGQQVVIEQGGEGLLRFGEGASPQRGRGLRADVSAGAQPEPPEEPLVVGFQRPVGEIEGRQHLRAGRSLARGAHR